MSINTFALFVHLTGYQFVDPLSFNVLGSSGPFRNDSELFNPTNSEPPFFQIFDEEFLNILGPNPSIKLIASNDTFAFAHEAPVWIPSTDEIFFASNDGGALGMSDINHNNQYSKINLTAAQNLKGGLIGITKVCLRFHSILPISECDFSFHLQLIYR